MTLYDFECVLRSAVDMEVQQYTTQYFAALACEERDIQAVRVGWLGACCFIVCPNQQSSTNVRMAFAEFTPMPR